MVSRIVSILNLTVALLGVTVAYLAVRSLAAGTLGEVDTAFTLAAGAMTTLLFALRSRNNAWLEPVSVFHGW
jgi:hypothetical protein